MVELEEGASLAFLAVSGTKNFESRILHQEFYTKDFGIKNFCLILKRHFCPPFIASLYERTGGATCPHSPTPILHYSDIQENICSRNCHCKSKYM
jgi:hypothetical protein